MLARVNTRGQLAQVERASLYMEHF